MDQYVTQDFIPLRSEDGRQSWMRQVRENEYEEAFLLIELTAKSGDNIGIGEIPTLDFFTTIMQKAVAVGLYDDNKTLIDLIIVKPYHVARHVRPVLCQIILASRDHPSEEEHLRQLVRVACELAQREECGGYKMFILEVFAYCLPHIQAFTLEGFHTTCAIPYAGQLAGHSGHVMSYIMYKEINAASPNTDQMPVGNLKLYRPTSMSPALAFIPTLLTIPNFLPLAYTCAAGMVVRIRHLRFDELPRFYAALSSSVGQGYGEGEIPTYEIFLQNTANNSYMFAIEEDGTEDVVTYFNVESSPVARCQTTKLLATVSLAILPEYRNRKLARDMIKIANYIVALCGYEHYLGSMAITFLPVVRSPSYETSHIVGVVPRAIYFTKTGWTDDLQIYTRLPFPGQIRSVRSLPIPRPLEFPLLSNFKPNLLTGPGFLPMKYRCTTGMDIIVRYLQPDELPKFYAALMTATDLGYGVDEMPTYEIFLQIRVNNFYNFVAEDVQTKKAVAYFNVGQSPCARCRTQNILSNGNLVLLPEYRSQSLGREMLHLFSFFTISCGFEHIVGRMAITNIPVVKSSVQEALSIVGVLPKSIYFTKTGWTDILIPYAKLPPTVLDSSVAAFIARASL